MSLKTRSEKVIEVSNWDKLVEETYKRPYSLQQQDNCHDRGRISITVPGRTEDYDNDTVPENVNDQKMGVSFKAWLARDPKQKLSNKDDQNEWSLRMWWERNFYPMRGMIANDLHAKGLLEAGKYSINIDW